jgi:hypothetical protein
MDGGLWSRLETRFLASLADTVHTVHVGLCLITIPKWKRRFMRLECQDRTRIFLIMRALDKLHDKEILDLKSAVVDWYVVVS